MLLFHAPHLGHHLRLRHEAVKVKLGLGHLFLRLPGPACLGQGQYTGIISVSLSGALHSFCLQTDCRRKHSAEACRWSGCCCLSSTSIKTTPRHSRILLPPAGAVTALPLPRCRLSAATTTQIPPACSHQVLQCMTHGMTAFSLGQEREVVGQG